MRASMLRCLDTRFPSAGAHGRLYAIDPDRNYRGRSEPVALKSLASQSQQHEETRHE
jgi:hypothetical protein